MADAEDVKTAHERAMFPSASMIKTKIFEKSTYTWIVKKFSALKTEVGYCIPSPIFPESCSKFKWKLYLYPNGRTKFINGTVIKLQNIFGPVGVVSHDFDFYVLDFDGKELYKEDFSVSLKISDEIYTERIGSRNDLMSQIGDSDIVKVRVLVRTEVMELEPSNEIEYDGNYYLGMKPLNDLDSIFLNKKFADVVLCVGDIEIAAHRCILAARSPVFAAMFEQNMQEKFTGRVQMFDLEADTINLLLQFIYSGKIDGVSDDSAKQLLIASDKYALADLTVHVAKFLGDNMHVSNAIDILLLADNHGVVALKERALKYISKKVSHYSDVSIYDKVVIQNPKLLAELLVKFSLKSSTDLTEELLNLSDEPVGK